MPYILCKKNFLFFFLVIRLRLKCCCGCVALTRRHIRPPPSSFSSHYHVPWRCGATCFLTPPPTPLQVSRAGPDIGRPRPFDGASLSIKKWQFEGIIRPGFCLPQTAWAYRPRPTVVWNEPRIKQPHVSKCVFTACWSAEVFDFVMNLCQNRNQNGLVTPSKICRRLWFSSPKGWTIQWIPGVGPKGLIWNHFHI